VGAKGRATEFLHSCSHYWAIHRSQNNMPAEEERCWNAGIDTFRISTVKKAHCLFYSEEICWSY